MNPSLGASITRRASRQTYYTIRTLVDGPRQEDAYRAYGYFRWVDDRLDAEAEPGTGESADRLARVAFLERQQALLQACLGGEAPPVADPHESMLVELVRHARSPRCELESYLANMMRVMAFDADRRGRLVAGGDLDAYTSWLAKAVTDAVSHFVGGGHAALDGDRYRAAAGAHILHMLRDTYEDVRVGYYNIPRERLEACGIGPEDIGSAAYRAWVSERVRLARSEFAAGRAYIARCDGQRYRLAGLAYIGRFEWLIERLERDSFQLQPRYDEPSSVATALRMGGRTAQRMLVRSGQAQ